MQRRFIDVEGVPIEIDAKGYLVCPNDWTEGVAKKMAENNQIDLTERHWEIIYELRDFYNQYNLSPSMRPLIKYLRSKLHTKTIDSIYLMGLFSGSPAAIAAKIAGLPRPDNCL